MSEAMQAILVAMALVLGSMLIGSVLYIVIRDAIKRSLHKD
jgi:hypothetical protein